MKLLLDTHMLLWLVDGDAQLTQPARNAIADPGNELFVSVATIWELAIKTTKPNSPLVLSDPLDVYLAKWSEPAILWTVCVADSGSGKSPAFEAARRPLDKLQTQAARQFERQTAEYFRWLQDPSGHLKSAGESLDLSPPSRQEEVFLEEAYREMIASAMAERPRGTAIVCEELTDWFERLSDVKRWLRVKRMNHAASSHSEPSVPLSSPICFSLRYSVFRSKPRICAVCVRLP